MGTAIQPKLIAEISPIAIKIRSGSSFLNEIWLNLKAIIGSVETIK